MWRCHNISLISDQIWGSNTQAGSYLNRPSSVSVRILCFQSGSVGGAGAEYRRAGRGAGHRSVFAKNSAHIEPDKWFLGDWNKETDEQTTDYWRDFLKWKKFARDCKLVQISSQLNIEGRNDKIGLRRWNINQLPGCVYWLGCKPGGCGSSLMMRETLVTIISLPQVVRLSPPPPPPSPGRVSSG